MTEGDALDRLVLLHKQLQQLGVEHRVLCEAVTPDVAALGRVRWRIAETGRHRMALLTGTVFPMISRICAGSEREGVESLRADTSAYRANVSSYVSRWSTSAIVAEWATYRREADGFRAQVARRLGQERELIVPLLRRRAVCPR